MEITHGEDNVSIDFAISIWIEILYLKSNLNLKLILFI